MASPRLPEIGGPPWSASRLSRGLAAALLVLAAVTSAHAWHAEGHRTIAGAAVTALRHELPEFFTIGIASVEDASLEADRHCDRQYTMLRNVERPEHYIDLELLQGRPLPESRRDYVDLCYELGIKPWNAGTVPYAIVEATERLTVALARHRRDPSNTFIQAQCLHYAGMLAHYTGDLAQPLHTTVHFNGRVGADGRSPQSGIHGHVDGLQELLSIPRDVLLRGVRPRSVESPWQRTLEQLRESHGLVDRVYELESALRAAADAGAGQPADPALRELAESRLRSGIQLTADLILTAWQRSAEVKVPQWDRN